MVSAGIARRAVQQHYYTKQGRRTQPERRAEFMKISILGLFTILLAAVFLAFSAGWFLHDRGGARPVRVETQRTLEQTEPMELPAPTPNPGTLIPEEKIDINTADLETLMTLPGIGETRAQAIIDDRQANGPFRIPEDLTRVSGIGESILAGFIDYITVS